MTMEIFRSLKIDPNAYIQAFEARVTPFMKENGMVDGKFLSRTLRVWKPRLVQYLPIPEEDFRLVDLVDKLPGILAGGAR